MTARARIALVGRPNAGKSSLFNLLTGGDAKVGNFPGVTVERLVGSLRLPSGRDADLVDLPGVYALGGDDASEDEAVAQRAIAELAEARAAGEGVLLVHVVDGTRLGLGLRLTRELVRTGVPFTLAVTLRDVLAAEGRELDPAALEAGLGAKVTLVDTRDPAEKERLLVAFDRELDRAVDRALEDRKPEAGAPSFDPEELAQGAVRDIVRDGVSTDVQRARSRTERLDRVLLHPLVGPVLFVALMAALFAAVFFVAEPVSAGIEAVTGWLGQRVEAGLGPGKATSFVVDGLLGGAGTVLGFLPQVVLLTVALEAMDASGYLARGTFLVDRALRLFGLGGKAFVPLLSAHACAVPAIASTRILKDPGERLRAILVLPLTTCSARIPTYALLIAAFFPGLGAGGRALLFVGLYAAGLASAMLASLALRVARPKGRALPLLLEMPAYHAPRAGLLARAGWRAAKRFAFEVGTTIVAISALLWALLTLPMPGSAPDPGAPAIESSVAASVGRALEPVTAPLGFDWRINVGLIGSFGAREVMVGTMGIVYGIEEEGDEPTRLAEALSTAKRADGTPRYSAATGYALLAFFVLACQCVSTVAAIRRETGSVKWAAFALAYTYAAAYVAALVVAQVARAAG